MRFSTTPSVSAAMSATIAAELAPPPRRSAPTGERVAALAGGLGRDREDLVAAIHEAERSLGVAERAVASSHQGRHIR